MIERGQGSRGLAQTVRRNGGTAWDDTGVRQKIASFACEAAAMQ